MTKGQELTFDQKVQQLFFNVDVSNLSTSLIDTFAKNKELAYIKPDRYGIQRLTGIDWTHTFKFKTSRFLINQFDLGIIELNIRENDKIKKVLNIVWKLEFEKKEDAVKVFDEMKNYFSKSQAAKKIYSSDDVIQTAEFSDKTAKKYPYIMFTLFDNKKFDKTYQIIFSLGNDSQYEN